MTIDKAIEISKRIYDYDNEEKRYKSFYHYIIKVLEAIGNSTMFKDMKEEKRLIEGNDIYANDIFYLVENYGIKILRKMKIKKLLSE